MQLRWNDLGRSRADMADGKQVEIAGFPLTSLSTANADRFLMMAEPGCCQGCVPRNQRAVVEVSADRPLKLGNGALRLRGRGASRPTPTAGDFGSKGPRWCGA